ncbi:MAG: methionine adenosyltransferase [Acholeplasmatales bacterium]|nr:MAG: methionine adenosyltransferase [Acholeplasmatales bacterium]
MPTKRLFTSESVTEGHPDKICDQISDAILDAILTEDPYARVAVETAVTTGLVIVMGEITTTTYVDIQAIVRKTVKEIGYDRGKYGFDAETMGVLVAIDPQSPDIAQGVDERPAQAKEIGAGDQGLMFGYATDETDEYMPLSALLAHRLAKRLSVVRKEKIVPYLLPDGKTQVTLEFDEAGKPVRIDTLVVSTQHARKTNQDKLRTDVFEQVIKAVIPSHLLDDKTKVHINPTGKFEIGGPQGDAGLTGRKIIVDTYGGVARHGGGCFSGKDATKVDRSGAYAARHIALNIVAAGLAARCEVQLSYAIGLAEPVAIHIESFNTATVPEFLLEEAVAQVFSLKPGEIIERFGMRRPIYRQTAAYGHFGRTDLNLPWEQPDHTEALKTAVAALMANR